MKEKLYKKVLLVIEKNIHDDLARRDYIDNQSASVTIK